MESHTSLPRWRQRAQETHLQIHWGWSQTKYRTNGRAFRDRGSAPPMPERVLEAGTLVHMDVPGRTAAAPRLDRMTSGTGWKARQRAVFNPIQSSSNNVIWASGVGLDLDHPVWDTVDTLMGPVRDDIVRELKSGLPRRQEE